MEKKINPAELLGVQILSPLEKRMIKGGYQQQQQQQQQQQLQDPEVQITTKSTGKILV